MKFRGSKVRGGAARLCFPLLAFVVFALTASADDFYYYQGRKIPLQRDARLVMLQFAASAAGKSGAAVESSAAALGGLGLQPAAEHSRPERNCYLYSSAAADFAGLKTQLRLPALSGAIAKIYPVYRNPENQILVFHFDEIAVRLRDAVELADVADLLARRGLSVLQQDPLDRHCVLLRAQSAPGDEILGLANSLARETRYFDWAEPNFYPAVERYFTPNDPLYPNQNHLRNTGQNFGTPGADLDAEAAWDLTRGDPSIVVAYLDDGMDMDHEDLAPNLFSNPGETVNGADSDGNGYIDDVSGWDFFSDDNNPRPANPAIDRHGTAVTGLGTAAQNNSKGVSGVAPQCRHFVCKIFGPSGTQSAYAGDFAVARAIRYAAQFCDVMSNSWGGGPPTAQLENAFRDARTMGRNGRGCVIVAASGNESQNITSYPSRYPWLISVGATTGQDIRASFSNYGPGLNIVAPLGAWTTDVSGLSGGYNGADPAGNYTSLFGGTSSSTPETAGVCALLLTLQPNLTHDQIAALLQAGAEKVQPGSAAYNTAGFSQQYGYGRVNAAQTLLLAQTAGDTADDQYENNDNFAAATPFATGIYKGLVALDEDWFRITLPAGQTLEVTIDYLAALHDPNLEIYDAAQQLVDSSASASNQDSAIVAAQAGAPRDFYIRVFGGVYNGHGYQLNIRSGGADDTFEQNDTLETAAPISTGTLTNLLALDDDYYRIAVQPLQGLAVQINFTHSQGDLDMLVYDADSNQLDISEGTTNQELITVQGTTTNTAFIVYVYGFAGAQNSYNMTTALISSAPNDDLFENNDTAQAAAAIVAGQYELILKDDDWFYIDVPVGAGTTATIELNHTLGDLDLKLYSETLGTPIDTSNGTQNIEQTSSPGIPGNTRFYVQVYGFQGAQNTYTLTIAVDSADDQYEENDTTATAAELSSGTFANLVLNDADYYRIDVPRGFALKARTRGFTAATSNHSIELLDSSEKVIDAAAALFNTAHVAAAGVDGVDNQYYLHIFTPDAPLNGTYELKIEFVEDLHEDTDDDPAGATAASAGQYRDQVAQETDWYQLPVAQNGKLAARIDHLSSRGDLDLTLFDGALNLIDDSVTTGDAELVELPLAAPADTYFVRVSRKAASGNLYDLTFDRGPGEKWLLAEGNSTGDFSSFLLIANPAPVTALVDVTCLIENGAPLTQQVELLPSSRFSVLMNSVTPGTRFGIQAQSVRGEGIYVERAMYWNPGGVFRGGGSDSIGTNAVSPVWLLAEGSTTNQRETFVLVANPNPAQKNIEITYLLQNAAPVVRNYIVGAMSRLTVDAANDVPGNDFSLKVRALDGAPIVAERTMFWSAGGVPRAGGHTAIGTPAVAPSWYFAEGATHAGFENFLLVCNPNDFANDVRFRFLLTGGGTIEQTIAIPAQQRFTLRANDVAGIDGTPHSAIVTGLDGDIVAERAMYWTAGGVSRKSGHVTLGAPQPSLNWLLPEGRTGGVSQFEEFVLIGNPNDQSAAVEYTFLKDTGEKIVEQYSVNPNSRFTLKLNSIPGLENASVSTVVRSLNNQPIVAERAMYWSANNTPRIEGHVSNGFPAATQ